MRKIILLLLFISSLSYSQTIDNILFEYDAAGNQVKRHVVYLGDRSSNQDIKDLKQLTDADLTKADIYDDIKYYPNPVVEELYVKWETSTLSVKNIELYAISGQLMKTYNISGNSDNQIISFINYPTGFYTVLLNYTNGEKKTLKIVKN